MTWWPNSIVRCEVAELAENSATNISTVAPPTVQSVTGELLGLQPECAISTCVKKDLRIGRDGGIEEFSTLIYAYANPCIQRRYDFRGPWTLATQVPPEQLVFVRWPNEEDVKQLVPKDAEAPRANTKRWGLSRGWWSILDILVYNLDILWLGITTIANIKVCQGHIWYIWIRIWPIWQCRFLMLFAYLWVIGVKHHLPSGNLT